MSFFHNENRPVSSNQFANGADQNCGNVITDRPTTRLHAPPGGKSSISFGGDDDSWAASSSRPVSKARDPISGVGTVSSNQFARGADQNCGNVITDRPTTRLHEPPGGKSSISFGGDDDSWAASSSRPVSKAKAREYVGNDIFGTGPAPAAAPPAAAVPAPSAAPVQRQLAGEKQIKSMMLPELRTICREHGLSPAGAKNTLVERIMEAIDSGAVQIYAEEEKISGVSNLTNNYNRAEGQNVGNFITDRNSSRVLRAPGGGSSISFGDGSPHRPGTATSRAKMAEMQGHDVFSDQREPDHNNDRYVVSSAKVKNDFQGHSIFDDGSNYLGQAKGVSDAKLQGDFQGHNIFGDGEFEHRPATATSSAKRAEISGQDVFSDGAPNQHLNDAITATRAMKLEADQKGHDIFSNEPMAASKRVTGGVHKPPGGGSSIVF